MHESGRRPWGGAVGMIGPGVLPQRSRGGLQQRCAAVVAGSARGDSAQRLHSPVLQSTKLVPQTNTKNTQTTPISKLAENGRVKQAHFPQTKFHC